MNIPMYPHINVGLTELVCRWEPLPHVAGLAILLSWCIILNIQWLSIYAQIELIYNRDYNRLSHALNIAGSPAGS